LTTRKDSLSSKGARPNWDGGEHDVKALAVDQINPLAPDFVLIVVTS